jgi:ABC-2 type transport system ATP-binding protein
MTQGDAAAEPLVHIQDFRMDFGETTVIEDLSFDVRDGETFGFLGSSGSGDAHGPGAVLTVNQRVSSASL